MLSGGWTGQSTVGRWIVFLVIIRSFMFAIKKLELVELSFLAGSGERLGLDCTEYLALQLPIGRHRGSSKYSRAGCCINVRPR